MDAHEAKTDVVLGHECRAEGRIVAIGASAGGLESLEQLFATLPADTGMSFIVIQHLSPDFRSLMDELIARRSQMPVVVAADGMPVEANHIYVLPPRKEAILRERRLLLTDREPHTLSLPIDTFFRSIAQDVGRQAIAIVLSGSGTDGSRGILDVHRAGGLVLAESPTSAKFDGMPLSAAATGIVAHVHTPRDIARLLCGLPPLEVLADAPALSDDPALDAVLRLLRDGFAIDFSLYKMTTVGRRIQRRVDLLRIANLQEYADQLATDPDELNKLYQDLLIGVTQFFRDPGAFDLLAREIVPRLLDRVRAEEELRIWVAGCATGEEAYSIAMLFWEQLAARERPVRLKILATDVHQRSLDIAGAGVYGEEQLANVSPARLERFFIRRSSGYQVSQDLRSLIVFARHNLTKDAPFTKMHFISCRNMLIYLQPQAQQSVLSLFHFGLAPQGVMFLGASETLGALTEEFTVLDEHWKVFSKRRDVQLLSTLHLPSLHSGARKPVMAVARAPGPDPLILSTYDQLLDLFMPPGFLVDEGHNVVDTFASAEKLLRFKRRRPTVNILELLDDDLRSVVAGAIQRAQKQSGLVAYSGVRVVTDDGEIRCTLAAQPLVHPRTGARHVLLTFRDIAAEDKPTGTDAVDIPVSEASRQRMATIEAELTYTKETLQATIEELETSNEEMQATNEELVASNEELQSTNEELHSVNEELYTVNAEYQQKISELKELNADMSHLLEGTDVGTVFLDPDLRIRRFTSRIANVFRFQIHDIGRQIVDFSHNIVRPELMDEIEAARRDGSVVEAEVRDRSGTPYFLRILPYRVQGQTTQISGVVLTLTDMTAVERARTKVDQLSAIVEASDDAIMWHALDGTITTWNPGAEELLGYAAEEAIGKNVRMLFEAGTGHQLDAALAQIRSGHKVEHLTALCMRKDGKRVDILTTLSPIYDQDELVGIAAIGRDVSRLIETRRALEDEKQKSQRLLEEAKSASKMREQFLAMLSHELRNPLSAVMNAILAKQARPDVARQSDAVVERQTAHMKRLLDDILDVSRITSDKFTVTRETIDLRTAIDTAIEATAPLFADRGVALDVESSSRAIPMRGDTARLTQVVANLLSNAANHSPRGGTVALTVAPKREIVEIRVADRGSGIAPHMIERIFDLFVQSEQKLDRALGGLGVGLSLAKSIVELHDGRIDAQSEGHGKGSAFTVTLPIDRTEADREQSSSIGETDARRILIVDDHDDSRGMLRLLFEAQNHVVFDASDGPNALEMIEQYRPDVAFIDIGLPVMNGFEIAQHVRRRRELDAVTLVALSGYGANSDVEAARAAGFDDHVTKPAEFRRLKQILARKRPAPEGS